MGFVSFHLRHHTQRGKNPYAVRARFQPLAASHQEQSECQVPEVKNPAG
jgi:hypothetical protein